MDFLHEEGVRFIHLLQKSFTHQRTVDVFVEMPQYFADPDTLMIFAFPLLLTFNQWLACRFAVTVGLVDMVNTVLKWILQGERPYWWVREANTNGKSTIPDLEHLPLTCETGPGSPSGHSMSAAAIGFVVISALLDQCVHKITSPVKRRRVERVLWFVYTCTVAMIGVARLRLATHFPHQVLLGAFAGVVGGWLVWNLPIERFQRKHYYAFALSLFLWAVITYFSLQLFGVDPNRTLQLALKHCAVRQYVKMSTTPWHSVYRNTALLAATGYCVTSDSWKKITSVQFDWKQRLPIMALSLLAAQSLASIPYPHQPTYIFYTCTLIKNTLIVVSCLMAAPLLIMHLFGTKTVEQTVKVNRKRSTIATTSRQG